MRIDHVFVFVEPGAAGPAGALAARGLVESYRRAHPGQGTANVCYCFDDAYLELLWATDLGELASPAVARTRLAERAQRTDASTSPFGIAVSTADPAAPLPFETWEYEAPFLPPGMSIDVARASEDPCQPFLFRSPGSSRPDAWTDGRAGSRQRAAGLAEIEGVRLDFSPGVVPADAFLALESEGLLTLGRAGGQGPRMVLSLSRAGSPDVVDLVVPDFVFAQRDREAGRAWPDLSPRPPR